jgi:hypothetical protein
LAPPIDEVRSCSRPTPFHPPDELQVERFRQFSLPGEAHPYSAFWRFRSHCWRIVGNLSLIGKVRFARHSLTIQKLICRSQPRERFRNLPYGGAAKLEEAQQQAEHEDGTEGMGDGCSEIHLTFEVAGNPDPPVRRSLGAQRLHNIDARCACRWQRRRDNCDRHQHERRDKHRQCGRHLDVQEISSR